MGTSGVAGDDQRSSSTPIDHPRSLDRLGWSPFHTGWWPDSVPPGSWTGSDHHLELGDRCAAKPADPGNDLDRGWADRIRVSDRGDDRRTGVWQDVGSAGPQAATDRDLAFIPARHRSRCVHNGHHTGWLVAFYATRFVAGMGIGGQYAAINSAIDEMMPSKYRGRVDIWINGTYWAGAILGSFASLIFLNAFAPNVGWRLAFLMGPVLALVVLVVGRTLPESPRWLMTHGRVEEAERELAKIEDAARKSGQELAPVDDSQAISLVPEKQYGYLVFLRLVFREYPKRAILGASLMITQSFLYNAIFFTYALVLVNLRDQRHCRPALWPRVLGREPVGAADPRPAVRHGRSEADDRRDLPALRRVVDDQRVAVRGRQAQRDHPDLRVGRDLLLRFGGRELGLSDGQRDLADRDPGRGDRCLLRDRPDLRSSRPGVLRRPDRRRIRPIGSVWGYVIGGLIMVAGGVIELVFGIKAEGQSLENVTKPLTAVSAEGDEEVG